MRVSVRSEQVEYDDNTRAKTKEKEEGGKRRGVKNRLCNKFASRLDTLTIY